MTAAKVTPRDRFPSEFRLRHLPWLDLDVAEQHVSLHHDALDRGGVGDVDAREAAFDEDQIRVLALLDASLGLDRPLISHLLIR